jgi:hypothetical protein
MTAERMAAIVARWVRLYTRGLPGPIAKRRIDEIDADVHDHITHERARGTGDRRIALGILSRMVRGLAADTSWRGRHTKQNTAYRSARRVALATALVLSVPLVAMQFIDEVAWGVFDFAVAAVLLGGTGLIHQLAARKAGNVAYRAAVGVALAAALFLVWSILAVGVIGDSGDAADLMYVGVLAVGFVGAVVARFQPHGMACALLAMALAQALVAVIALIAGKHQAPISSVSEILGVNALFVALFIASAWLFRHAARKQPTASARQD